MCLCGLCQLLTPKTHTHTHCLFILWTYSIFPWSPPFCFACRDGDHGEAAESYPHPDAAVAVAAPRPRRAAPAGRPRRRGDAAVHDGARGVGLRGAAVRRHRLDVRPHPGHPFLPRRHQARLPQVRTSIALEDQEGSCSGRLTVLLLLAGRLFQYLMGANLNSSRIRMTTPVLTSVVPGAGPLRSSAYSVRLYLPAKFQASPPVPLPELNLHPDRWPGHCVAARSFSGRARDKNVVEEAEKLAMSLSRSPWANSTDYSSKSAYSVAQYSSPFRIIGRVNEVWFDVNCRSTAAGVESY